jgi:hypothetical protein
MEGKTGSRKWTSLLAEAINKRMPFFMELFSNLAWKG